MEKENKSVFRKEALARISSPEQMEDYMQNGKIQTIAGIFLLKNNHGYTDKTEIEVSTKQDADSSPDELAAKYADAIPADFTVNEDTES